MLAGPIVAERFRLPGLVGVVLGGTLVGPFVLDWVPREGIIDALGALGLLYLMFFAGLFAMYFVARAQAHGNWPPPPTELNLAYAVPVTLVLIASSFTCQMGVFAAERGDVFGLRRWYLLTLAMGTFFVLGQGYEYIHLIEEGTTTSSSAYGSVFYITTGFHGLHVIGGLVAFVFLMIRTKLSKFTPAQATAAIVVSY